MTYSLAGKRVVVVGGTSDVAHAIAEEVGRQDGRVTLAGRDLARTRDAARSAGADAMTMDLTDEASIQLAAASFEDGGVDHLVNVAAARAMGPVSALTRQGIMTALNAKIVGPILLAKHFASLMPDQGSMVLFAGVGGWRPQPGGTVIAAGNGGVASLAAALAVELAPMRVNAVSPGTIDTSAWDAVPNKQDVFQKVAQANPARRVGTVQDVAAAVVALLVNPFATGETLHLDGGARWA